MSITPDEARRTIGEVLATITPEIDLDTCDFDEPMNQELDLDSMDMLELITGIHERTGIPIPEGEVKPEWSLSELIAELGRR